MTSAGTFVSNIYKGINNISSYYNLHDINENLQSKCADLELEVIRLKENIRLYNEIYNIDTISNRINSKFEYILAHVINNSITHSHNYITINKGYNDGVKPEMGVVDQNGVVGIVNIVGKNSARVISLLNPNLRLSCKIKGHNNFGSLIWDGIDPTTAILEELPRHTIYQKGDTIITSGYSSVFPEGIPVGTIISDKEEQNENFFTLKIKLSADFSKLSTVRIVINHMKSELDSLEIMDVNKNKK